MIISASRRTDIAAFYAPWFMNRVRAGFCSVPNPMNRKQVSQISLAPADVDAIVFWTRDPRPLLPHMAELDARGFHYYFQFSLLGYPRQIDPKSPSTRIALNAFRHLAEHIGPERVIWRYDPMVFSAITPPSYHETQFGRLAEELRGSTHRCVVSVVDIYRKLQGRLQGVCRHASRIHGYPARNAASVARTPGPECPCQWNGDYQLCRGRELVEVGRSSRKMRGRRIAESSLYPWVWRRKRFQPT